MRVNAAEHARLASKLNGGRAGTLANDDSTLEPCPIEPQRRTTDRQICTARIRWKLAPGETESLGLIAVQYRVRRNSQGTIPYVTDNVGHIRKFVGHTGPSRPPDHFFRAVLRTVRYGVVDKEEAASNWAQQGRHLRHRGRRRLSCRRRQTMPP